MVAILVIGGMFGGGGSDPDTVATDSVSSGDSTSDKAETESDAEPKSQEGAKSGASKPEPEPKPEPKPKSQEGAKSGASKPEPEPKPEPKPKPAAVEVSAVQMLEEFEANEAAADARYKGKTVKVTGTAVKVDTEFMDDEQYVIRINGGGDFDILSVNCNDVSAEQAAKVKVDSRATVIGTFDDGGDLGVELKDCKVT